MSDASDSDSIRQHHEDANSPLCVSGLLWRITSGQAFMHGHGRWDRTTDGSEYAAHSRNQTVEQQQGLLRVLGVK